MIVPVVTALLFLQVANGLQKTIVSRDGEFQHPLSTLSNSLYDTLDVRARDPVIVQQPNLMFSRNEPRLPISSIYSAAPNVYIPRQENIIPFMPQTTVQQVVEPQFGYVGGYSYGKPSHNVYSVPVPTQEVISPKFGYIGGYTYANEAPIYTPRAVTKTVRPVYRDSDVFKVMQMQNPIGYRFF